MLKTAGENSKLASMKRTKLVDILMFKGTLVSCVYVADGVSDGMGAYLELMLEQVKISHAEI